MWIIAGFFFCSTIVVVAENEVDFHVDKPFMRVYFNEPAVLECCYNTKGPALPAIWTVVVQETNKTLTSRNVTSSGRVTADQKSNSNTHCNTLSFSYVEVNDSGMYQCFLPSSKGGLSSHGTYLHVSKPMAKTFKLAENTKNRILTAEGILLFLCVLMPATTLLCQTRKLNELERKKVTKEEENIYQGLNLDDCCSTYDQIERSQGHGPYQDVCNIAQEEEEIQLEKP